jgi:MinD-like ATPase involved in chromosome partitioning or flagellar assembly
LAVDAATRRTYLILLDEPHAWVAAAALARSASPRAVEALIAPLPGVRFLAARGGEASELDEWWSRMATAPGRAVVLAAHEDDLPAWIPGLDADFVVAVPDDAALGVYRTLPNVVATVDDDPRRLAEIALRGPVAAVVATPLARASGNGATAHPPIPLGGPGLPPPKPGGPTAAPPDTSARDQPPRRQVQATGFEPVRHEELRSQPPSPPPPAAMDPFRLLTGAEPVQPARPRNPSSEGHGFRADPGNGAGRGDRAHPAGPISRRDLVDEKGQFQPMRGQAASSPPFAGGRGPQGRPGGDREDAPEAPSQPPQSQRRPGPARGFDPRQILDRLGQGRRAPVGAELGQAVLGCKPVVVAVVSRKGGVGKTASAAAVAAILGEALDPYGHTAALVDANIGNPDAWGRLDTRGPAPTVREVVRSLMAGQEPPAPAYAETPALAVYPESREAGDGYAPAQIQRVAGYLKGRHAVVLVDLPNRLPAFTSPEAAVAAAWIAEADVLVLPTTGDPTALLGAIEYLDADSVAGKPVVVSYIVPRIRQIRDAPQVRGMLDRIRAVVAAVVEVPDDDRATLAVIKRVAITEVGGELRQAYLVLASRVVEAAAARRGGWS